MVSKEEIVKILKLLKKDKKKKKKIKQKQKQRQSQNIRISLGAGLGGGGVSSSYPVFIPQPQAQPIYNIPFQQSPLQPPIQPPVPPIQPTPPNMSVIPRIRVGRPIGAQKAELKSPEIFKSSPLSTPAPLPIFQPNTTNDVLSSNELEQNVFNDQTGNIPTGVSVEEFKEPAPNIIEEPTPVIQEEEFKDNIETSEATPIVEATKLNKMEINRLKREKDIENARNLSKANIGIKTNSLQKKLQDKRDIQLKILSANDKDKQNLQEKLNKLDNQLNNDAKRILFYSSLFNELNISNDKIEDIKKRVQKSINEIPDTSDLISMAIGRSNKILEEEEVFGRGDEDEISVN